MIIVLVALAFRVVLRGKVVEAAREQATRGLAGSMEGHAAMDMSVDAEGSVVSRLLTRQAFTSVSRSSPPVAGMLSMMGGDPEPGRVVVGVLGALGTGCWVRACWVRDGAAPRR